MSLRNGAKIVTGGLVFSYDMDNTKKSFKGEPTTNLIPGDHNSRFTTSNGWGTYNTNQYNSNTYFNIGTVASVSNNEVTMSSWAKELRTYDVVRCQTSGGGLTAGTNYFVYRTGTNTFTLHAYNSSQNGSQGYINPVTGKHKVYDSIHLDQRISINATDFPTMWWGPPHLPNAGLVKEIVEGAGPEGQNVMRLHQPRTYGRDGMAYGVYTPVTLNDQISVSFYVRGNGDQVGRAFSFSTYFGSGYASSGSGITLDGTWQRIEHTWTSSNTFGMYLYFWPSNVAAPAYVDMCDLQVEVNKQNGPTPYTLPSQPRTTTNSLIDLIGYSNCTGHNLKYNSDDTFRFDGQTTYADFTFPQTTNMGCLEFWQYNNYRIKGDNGSQGSSGGQPYQTMIQFNGQSSGVRLDGWTGSATNEALHIWTSTDATSGYNGMTYTRDPVEVGWHHFVFNWNGSSYDIWVDGVKKTTYPISGGVHAPLQPLNSFRIGHNGSTYYFDGILPVTRMYNRGLTDAEINQNFNALRGRFGI